MTAQGKRVTLIIIGALVVLGVMAFVVNSRLAQIGAPLSELQLGGTGLNAAPRNADEPLPVLDTVMPQFAGIDAWLNSDELTPEKLKGKVVLVDFWTYSCINCIRTLPYVTSWYEKYKDKGFVVVGVHTPEFDFEKSQKNVEAALKRHGITYPVALDNGYGTWNNYENHYWPAHYLFDAKGQLRHTHFGEGAYDETEHDIQTLLAEAGTKADMPLTEEKSDIDFQKIGTPETYVGYERQEYFGSPESVGRDVAKNYSIPEVLRLNTFALLGTWKIEGDHATLADGQGTIAHHFSAANANLVMGSAAKVRAEVTLDGAPVSADKRGSDVYEQDGKTYVDVQDQRLYDLIDTRGEYGTHALRLQFEKEGVECYAFTFG